MTLMMWLLHAASYIWQVWDCSMAMLLLTTGFAAVLHALDNMYAKIVLL